MTDNDYNSVVLKLHEVCGRANGKLARIAILIQQAKDSAGMGKPEVTERMLAIVLEELTVVRQCLVDAQQ